MSTDRPPKPWYSFLKDVDARVGETIHLHCLGGFAVTMLYGLVRPTADVDYLEVRPQSEAARLQEHAGEGSPLHRKHGVYVQKVTVATLPDSYEERLREMFPGTYKRIRLWGLDPTT